MLNSLIKETLKLLHHGFAVHTAHEGGDTPFSPYLPFSQIRDLNWIVARNAEKNGLYNFGIQNDFHTSVQHSAMETTLFASY